MDKNEDFLIFSKVSDELNEIIEAWDPKKL
jgi:hypothetical protein